MRPSTPKHFLDGNEINPAPMNSSNEHSLPTHSNSLPWPAGEDSTSEISDLHIRLDQDQSREEVTPVPVDDGRRPEGREVRFKVRIVDIDHSMVAPGPLDLNTCQFLPQNTSVLKVPVVRIYGANEGGQKTCLHVHQAGACSLFDPPLYSCQANFLWRRRSTDISCTLISH
jgi:hypothetical protein